MIAGCYTPVMIHCRCFRMLAFVWTCALSIRVSKSYLDMAILGAFIGFFGELSLYAIWKQTTQELDSALQVGSTDMIFHHARYLMMGWSVVMIWNHVSLNFSKRGKALMCLGHG
ncbi:unnamed protein product [Effrenium voratum]|nr:unnamed protein product [Effrenium voratum]